VIHWLLPSGSAVRPSSVAASFTRTHGRARSMREKKPRLSSRAWSRISPTSTAMPAARSRASPAPSTCGNGSSEAATTRATRAAISASAQGPVRPWWAQGSSVT
jgi:hypothetical protein